MKCVPFVKEWLINACRSLQVFSKYFLHVFIDNPYNCIILQLQRAPFLGVLQPTHEVTTGGKAYGKSACWARTIANIGVDPLGLGAVCCLSGVLCGDSATGSLAAFWAAIVPVCLADAPREPLTL